ncbi:MAG: hypothetical protein HZA89_11595 [Verrucomicrobia bacterium]|nr:hypothetical protein [Verrucomicrobiota bacterium]
MRAVRLLLLSVVCPVLAAFAQDKVTFDDHVLPIFRNACLKCHNPDKLKGDLDLTTVAALLKGGGSGPGAISGDPSGSKLLKVITHDDEMKMPSESSKLPDKEIDLIRKWIAGGLLENSGSKAIPASRPKVDLYLNVVALGKPDGPPPMPGELSIEAEVRPARGTPLTALAASPWAPLAAIGAPRQVVLYHTGTRELLGVLPFFEGFPVDLKFSRNGRLLLAGGGHAGKSGKVVVWDIATGDRIIAVGDDEFDAVQAADISPDQKWIALGGQSRLVKIYSTKTGELEHKKKKHTDWVTAMEFSPDNQHLATADRNGGITVWETATGQEVITFAGHKAAVNGLAWRPDSTMLASASEDGTVKIWKTSDNQSIRSITAHDKGVLSVHYAMDGRLVTAGRDNKVVIWNKGEKAATFPDTNALPVRARFTGAGTQLLVSDFTGRVKLWNAESGKPAGELDAYPPPLAERLARAQKSLSEALVAGDATAADAARANVEKLKVAQASAALHRAKTDLAQNKAGHERLVAEAAAAKESVEKLGKEIAEAKKSSPKTKTEKDELAKKLKKLSDRQKLAQTKSAAAKSAADKLAREIAAAQSRVDKLAAAQQRAKTASPAKSARL